MVLTTDVALLSETLKKATKTAHADAEAVLLRRIKNIQQHDDYVSLLSLMHGYYAPIEKSVSSFLNDHLLPHFAQRKRSYLLQEDAAAIGAHINAKEATTLPCVQSAAQAWGVWYVLEGSTLGGVHIAAMLQKKLLLPDGALRFFKGYGEDTAAMWQTFRRAINEAVQNPEQQAAAVAAATETFLCMKAWMEGCGK